MTKEKFTEQYFLLEKVLQDIQTTLNERISVVMVDPELKDNKEFFPEGYIAPLVDLLSNVKALTDSAKDLRHYLTICNNALLELEKIKGINND